MHGIMLDLYFSERKPQALQLLLLLKKCSMTPVKPTWFINYSRTGLI